MLKRFFSTSAASLGLVSASLAASTVVIGSASVASPDGWREVKKEAGRIVFRSPNDRQQATISLMTFGVVPSFADFKRLCALRLQAEKKGAPGAFFEPDAPEPYERAGRYGMLYSGGEKKTGRIFSCYLSASKNELITVYVEAVGVTPADHLASFEAFVSGLKRE